MDEKEIYFEDNSGDKKYFTMLPNIILNHSTANDQALYCQLKKHAGERGICFVSERNLMKKLGIGDTALKTSFAYLLKRGWIKYEGLKDVMSNGGMQKTKSYSVVDIWKENINNYEGASKTDPLTTKVLPKTDKVLLETLKGGLIQETNKNPLIKTKEEPNTFSLKDTNTEENQLTPNEVKERLSIIRKNVIEKLSLAQITN